MEQAGIAPALAIGLPVPIHTAITKGFKPYSPSPNGYFRLVMPVRVPNPYTGSALIAGDGGLSGNLGPCVQRAVGRSWRCWVVVFAGGAPCSFLRAPGIAERRS